MKGSCDLSAAQFHMIYMAISRNNMYNRDHKVVTVVIHPTQTMGVRRVNLHRAEADSINFGVLRDGTTVESWQAA